MDGEGVSSPADSMIVVKDSVKISLGEVGVESGTGESELQGRVFITSPKNRNRTTTVATKQQERGPEKTPVQQNKPKTQPKQMTANKHSRTNPRGKGEIKYPTNNLN
jgi:hypothetical protein